MLTASMLLRQAAEKPSCHGENSMASAQMGQWKRSAGCSKRPDFSPSQPWRAETRLVHSKAAGEARTGGGTDRTSWGRSPVQWILANGKTPPALPPFENINGTLRIFAR